MICSHRGVFSGLRWLLGMVLVFGGPALAGRPEPGVRYIHPNHIGSALVTTDEVGRASAQHVFRPYGERDANLSSEPSGTRVGFTGKERDGDSGLAYYEGRYYDPQLARFTRRDPGRGAADNHPAAWNRYAYAGGNPITVLDPSGYWIDPPGETDPEPEPDPEEPEEPEEPEDEEIFTIFMPIMGGPRTPVGTAQDQDHVVSPDGQVTEEGEPCASLDCATNPSYGPSGGGPGTPAIDAGTGLLVWFLNPEDGTVHNFTDFFGVDSNGNAIFNLLPFSASVSTPFGGGGVGLSANVYVDENGINGFELSSHLQLSGGLSIDISGLGLGAEAGGQRQFILFQSHGEGANQGTRWFVIQDVEYAKGTVGPVSATNTFDTDTVQEGIETGN